MLVRVQALCRVWTAFATLLPSGGWLWSGALGSWVGSQRACDLTHWVSVWKTIEGSWFVLGMFPALVSLKHHGIHVPVTSLWNSLNTLREGWEEQ